MCEAVYCHSGAKEDDTIAIQFTLEGRQIRPCKDFGQPSAPWCRGCDSSGRWVEVSLRGEDPSVLNAVKTSEKSVVQQM
jgi:hypothetical protein